MILWLTVFIVSLFVLIRAADLFIDASENISILFNIPSFIIGATLVSIGTSLPELVSSSFSVIEGASEIVVGNVVGSNISNILLIFGITMPLMKGVTISFSKLKTDFIILFVSAILLCVAIWDRIFSLPEIIIFMAGMIAYIFYVVKFHKIAAGPAETNVKRKISKGTYLKFIISGIAIFFSAKFTVDAIIQLAIILEIGAEIIALTVVSLGTSIPELAVSIAAARKGLSDIVIGNILGSNIFNTFAVMSIPSFFGKLNIPEEINYFSLPVFLIATLLFFIIGFRQKGGIVSGIIFLVLYAFFIIGIVKNWDLRMLPGLF